ncbi:MAG: hypothetical protein LBS53_08990 [Synergistaceae bacterium]|nr:hypothetical protein [Synergistaceae bacterium]
MRKILVFAIICFVCFFTGMSFAAGISTDDIAIKTPAQTVSEDQKAALREVKQPDKVKVTPPDDVIIAPTVEAASANDALNTVLDSFVKTRTEGYRDVEFPGGFGVAATGIALYDVIPNNAVASRISKRQAYAIAYLSAKNLMTAWAEGQILKLRQLSGNRQTSVSDNNDNLNNILEKWHVFMEIGVEGVIRRHTVYDVYDDPLSPRVYVTIMSCPVLWGVNERPAAETVAASSIISGLDTVFTEINNKITTPIGGKAVFIPETGELAYVGYGSEVVRTNENPAALARLELNAERIARMRAQVSLLNMILPNERLKGDMSLDDLTLRSIQDIEEAASGDVTATTDATSFQRIQQQKDLFHNSQEFKMCVDAANSGKLPPGVQQKSWLDDGREFAYAVAIYIPSHTYKIESNKPAK